MGHSLPLALVIILLALIGGLVGSCCRAALARAEAAVPPAVRAARGHRPGTGAYIFTEHISRTAYVASIMEAAEKGAVDLTRDGSGWTLVDKKGEAGWAKTDEITARIGRLVGGPGGSFTTGSTDVRAGQEVAEPDR